MSFGMTCKGGYHRKYGLPNQDAYCIKGYRTCHVGVVCDGLGSKKFSHIGSSMLTRAVANTFRLFSNKPLGLLEPLIQSLWRLYIDPYSPRECLSTLLVVAVLKREGRVVVGRAGDGMVVLLGQKDILLEEFKEGPSNITTPFTYAPIEWQSYPLDAIDSIFMCSDGISEPLIADQKIAFVRAFMQEYTPMRADLRRRAISTWLKKYPTSLSDDKTFVAMHLC
ncbi:protein phosphatase 2C domain-containing protein [Helicobacter bizzozeronii]|uniref:protein phosphatase 2C domain-containing protein n=1 Tax=Helicobacter bizzozeronii TaxID=56877 RepID=UPI0025570904|nr:protein phosphatase 2C domain-containing protein [Helicobacter bizzozeronii]